MQLLQVWEEIGRFDHPAHIKAAHRMYGKILKTM